MKKLAVPIILTVVISALIVFVLIPNFTPTPLQQASEEAVIVDDFLNMEFAIMGVIFALCMVFFFYSIVVWRRKDDGGEEFGLPIHGNLPLEIAWTVVPLIIVIILSLYTAPVLNKMIDTDGYDLEIEVTGLQWSWRFDYPDSGITSADLILPAGQKIMLTMTAEDVIHSFWVPEFRVKQDLVPGRETTLIITPTELGDYKVRCAELCGSQHAYMLANVQVVSAQEYDTWVTSQTELPDDPAERGAIFAKQYGCIACHSIDGSVIVGPSWQNLYGKTELITGGTEVEVDEAYLYESIVDPGALIVEGFADAMPKNYGTDLEPEQIDDLIAYIISLSDN